MEKRSDNRAMKQYYIELYQPTSQDELKSFHTNIILAIHDQSHKTQTKHPLSYSAPDPKYESFIGLSYPLFGNIHQYIDTSKVTMDLDYEIYFADKHPGLYIGSVVHCVSTNKESLERLWHCNTFTELRSIDCHISDLHEVNNIIQTAVFKRDRRADRRTQKYQLKSTKPYSRAANKIYIRPSIREPAPWIKRGSHSIYIKKENPAENNYITSEKCNHFYSIFGFSQYGSLVPILPVKNTNFSMELINEA